MTTLPRFPPPAGRHSIARQPFSPEEGRECTPQRQTQLLTTQTVGVRAEVPTGHQLALVPSVVSEGLSVCVSLRGPFPSSEAFLFLTSYRHVYIGVTRGDAVKNNLNLP